MLHTILYTFVNKLIYIYYSSFKFYKKKTGQWKNWIDFEKKILIGKEVKNENKFIKQKNILSFHFFMLILFKNVLMYYWKIDVVTSHNVCWDFSEF